MKSTIYSILIILFFSSVCIADIIYINTNNEPSKQERQGNDRRTIFAPNGGYIVLLENNKTNLMKAFTPDDKSKIYTFWLRNIDQIAGTYDYILWPGDIIEPSDGSNRIYRLKYMQEYQYWFYYVEEYNDVKKTYRRTSDFL